MASAQTPRPPADNDVIRDALEKVYISFRNNRVADLSKVTCFDCGPNDEELAGISKELRSIPDETVSSMEFFGSGWETWGTKAEVKYFLPRILEYLAEDVRRLEDPGLFSLFKYKLRDCFSANNGDWTEDERASLRGYFNALLALHLPRSCDVGILMECSIALGIRPEDVSKLWSAQGDLRDKQITAISKHFGISSTNDLTPGRTNITGVLYLDDKERMAAFLRDLLR